MRDDAMNADTRVYTIGFTESSAESFFTRLQQAGVRRVIDVRLNSEHRPHRCHRRLVAEYLSSHWGGVETTHL